MTVRLRAGVSATDTDYGSTLLDLDTGDYFNLNPTGTLVLHRLLEGDSPSQAATRLTEEYAVARHEAEQDVAELIAALVAAGLVETTPDDAVPDGAAPDAEAAASGDDRPRRRRLGRKG